MAADPALWALDLHGTNSPLDEEAGDAGKALCRELVASIRATGIPTVERFYEAGDLVCGEDERGSALHVVSRGVVRLSATRSGARQAILRLAGPWEPASVPTLASALMDGPSGSVRAEAFTPCGVIKVPKVFVERAVRERPEVGLKLAALLALEICRREELYECLLPRTTEARLARLLPILARDFGEQRDGAVVLGLRITHYDLAAMVASTRESVTAAVGALRQQGILEKKAGTITLLRPEELEKISDPW